MATITKVNNNIVIQTDNSSTPSVFSNWRDADVKYADDRVILTIGNKGFIFTDDWAVSPVGKLTSVNGNSLSGKTNAQIADIIRKNVLTEDQFSGKPTLITSTTTTTGNFTAIQIDEDTVFNVTAGSGTLMLDGFGNAISLSGWSGVTFNAGTTKYGNFSQIKLVSGKVTAYSNL